MNDKVANGKALIRERTIERFLARSAVQYGRAPNVDPGDGSGFTVLSYNIGNGMAKPGPLVDFLENETADIVGLQELAVPQAEAIASRLSEKYPHQILVPTGFSGKGLLSRFPLIGGASVSFNPDRPDLSAHIEVGGDVVKVFVAHPRPPKVTLSGVMFDPITQNQIEMVAVAAMKERPSVILGDFNLTERQAEHVFIRSHGLIDAFQELGHRAASFPKRLGQTQRIGSRGNRIPLTPVIRIDYIWYTEELHASTVWVGKDAGSDHLPVHARLHFRDQSETGPPESD